MPFEQRVYGVTGWKNSGKTTLMEQLVREIAGRDFRVSTIKHAHHAFDVDHAGKDSWRHRQAGAQEVLIGSRKRWALMHELRGCKEPLLGELLRKMAPVDLILVEGYKRDRHPKIEATRAESRREDLIAQSDPTIRAIAADGAAPVALDLPCYALDDVAGIADFILLDCGLRR